MSFLTFLLLVMKNIIHANREADSIYFENLIASNGHVLLSDPMLGQIVPHLRSHIRVGALQRISKPYQRLTFSFISEVRLWIGGERGKKNMEEIMKVGREWRKGERRKSEGKGESRKRKREKRKWGGEFI
jgi:hypothetical protein